MTGHKYEQYIITDYKPMATPPPAAFLKRIEEQRKAGVYNISMPMFRLDDSIAKGAFYVDCHWLFEKKGEAGLQTETAHTHDFDELLGFVGSMRENPRELDAEIEVWLEDEKYMITKSCLIFVPRGLRHLPLVFHRIDHPVFFWTMGNGTSYTRTKADEF